MVDFLSPYKAKVDSINKHVIAKSLYNLNSDNRNGGYANLSADYAHWYGKLVLDSLPELNKKGLPLIGIMNVGGIRQNMPEGDVTEGEILSTFPFANHMVLMELSGKDLLSSLRAAVKKGGECISENIRVITDGDSKIIRMFVDDKEVSDSDLFLVSTIDYLSEGNDDFIGLANGEILWRDNKEMCAPVIRYIKSFTEKGLPIAPDQTGRFQKEITLP
jgi:2',3'-cyclic-nucleotide 2'-phosphodiesterase (5'-nucleotidase family)